MRRAFIWGWRDRFLWLLQPNLAGLERSIGEALGGDEGEKSLARERIEKEEAGSVGGVQAQ